jgi:four helix bundle protein
MRRDGNNAKNGKDGKNTSHDSHSSHPTERLLPPRGDYQTLLSFQKAEIIYDLTFRFAHKHLAKTDRTVDQMIQSARSGKKNILEGSKAAITSKETEIKLTNVARASLEELLDDYKDYLRARDLKIWPKDSKEAQYVRKTGSADPTNLRGLPRVRGYSPCRSRGQHRALPYPPDQLPPRPATSSAGGGFCKNRRPARTHDPRSLAAPEQGCATGTLVTPATRRDGKNGKDGKNTSHASHSSHPGRIGDSRLRESARPSRSHHPVFARSAKGNPPQAITPSP